MPLPTIQLDDISCAVDLLTYSINLTSNGTVISSTEGTVINNGGGSFSVNNIPSGINVIITSADANNCISIQAVNAPDCNCPTTNPPSSGGDQSICEGEPIPTLNVMVGSGEIANWYSQPTGGTLLAMNTTSYTPSGPGIFYVETEELISGCTSNSRTGITLTIFSNPIAGVIVGSTELCINNTIVLTTNPPVGTAPFIHNWAITGGSGTADIVNNNDGTVSITGNSQGTLELSYFITDNNGCSSTIVIYNILIENVPTPYIETAGLIDPKHCFENSGGIFIQGLVTGQDYIIEYTQDGIPMSYGPITAANDQITLPNLGAGSYDNIVVSNINISCTPNAITGGPFILENPIIDMPFITSTSGSNPSSCNSSDGIISIMNLINGNLYSVTYLWNGIPQTITGVVPDANGIITIPGLNGGVYSDFVITNVNTDCISPAIVGPVILASPNAPSAPILSVINFEVCAGENIQFDIISPTTLPSGATLSWTGPNGFSTSDFEPFLSSVSNIQEGIYEVVITQNNCSSSPAFVEVIVNEVPSTPTIDNNQSICSNEDLILSTNSNCQTYYWIAPGTSPNDVPQNPLLITSSNQAIIPFGNTNYQSGSLELSLCK